MAQSFDDWLNSGSGNTAPTQPVRASQPQPRATQQAPSQQAQSQSFDDWLGSTPSQGPVTPVSTQAPAPALTDSQPTQPQMGFFESLGRSAMHHAGNALHGGAQLIEHGVGSAIHTVAPGSSADTYAQGVISADDAALAKREADYQATVPNNIGSGIGAAVGEIAPMVVAGPLGIGRRLMQSTAALPMAARLAARVGIGAGQGAAMGALQPTITQQAPTGLNDLVTQQPQAPQSFGDQKLNQIQNGALFGGAGVPIGAAAGRLLAPVGNAAANALRQAGVRTTPLQTLGPAGAKMEQQLGSVPVVGDIINSARNRANNDFMRTIANDTLEPIGQRVPNNVRTPSDIVDHVYDTLGTRFNNIAQNAQVHVDDALTNDISTARNQLAANAPGLVTRFDNIVGNTVTNKAANNGGSLSGQQWGDSRSMLNYEIRRHSSPTANSDDQYMADALRSVQGALASNAEHYSGQSVANDLRAVNQAYARFKTMQTAAGTIGGVKNENLITPSSYLNAARKGQSAQMRATSSAPMTQLAQQANTIIGNTVPDSGTAGRVMMGGLAAMNPALLLKAAPIAAAYMPGVRDVVPTLLTQRPNAVRALAPHARQLGPLVGGMLGGATASPQQPQQNGLLDTYQ